MEEFKLDLNKRQIRALKGGKIVQLKPACYGKGEINVKLHPEKAKKLKSAMRRNKGMRLSMAQDEIEATGGGLWDSIKNFFKKAWSGYKKYVKPVAGPAIRKGLETGIEKGIEVAGLAVDVPPTVTKPIGKYASKKLVPLICDYTQACGVTSGGRVVRFNTNMASPSLPAANPLINIGSPYYGTQLVKGTGFGMTTSLAKKHAKAM